MTDARGAARLLPEAPGVYRFRDERGRVAYVGRATNPRARVRSYWGELSDRPQLRRMITTITTIEAIECASSHEAAWLERNLLQRSLPRWNRIRGGAETPNWLVVDDDPLSPGLNLSFDAPDSARAAYGPYLGYERSVLARDALLRLYPLHLTSSRPDSAQSALAEARGVSPDQRAGFADRLRAVLGREPDALSDAEAALLGARDRAAVQLAFETAQQIQLELGGLAWILAEQRVTGCVPEDLRVCGWAAGVQFSLAATDGRLDRWVLKPADETPGRRAADRTPAAWQEFARRNAELAATLAEAQRG